MAITFSDIREKRVIEFENGTTTIPDRINYCLCGIASHGHEISAVHCGRCLCASLFFPPCGIVSRARRVDVRLWENDSVVFGSNEGDVCRCVSYMAEDVVRNLMFEV
mgnify:CR=1 FL=1